MLLRSTIPTVGCCLFVAACATTRIRASETGDARALSSRRESEAAAQEVGKRKYSEALTLAEHAAAVSPDNAWAHHWRAVALHHLGRIDAAIGAFRDAEARFGDANPRGKAMSIYGRARTLDDAGRCEEAKAAYAEYAAFVRPSDPRSADLALAYAEDCRRQAPPGDASR